MMRFSQFCFFGAILVLAFSGNSGEEIKGKFCGDLQWTPEKGEESVYVVRYTCPRPEGSQKATECCDPPRAHCCAVPSPGFFFEWLETIIGVSVILVAIIIASAIIACCCWERCPLYSFCRREAKPDYIGTSEEAESLANEMPSENARNVKVFFPAKVTKKDTGDFV